MYKALLRSRIEYGLISYGSSSQGRQNELESIQYIILRLILGAPKTTSIKELQCELGLEQVEIRRTLLAGRYLLQIDQQPNHPLYQNCHDLRKTPKVWKDQNVPSLKIATAHTILADVNLFQNLPGYSQQLQELLPWKESPIKIASLPVAKNAAIENPRRARALFNETLQKLPTNSIAAFCGWIPK